MRQTPTDEVHNEEPESPRVAETTIDNDIIPEEHVPKDYDMEKP